VCVAGLLFFCLGLTEVIIFSKSSASEGRMGCCVGKSLEVAPDGQRGEVSLLLIGCDMQVFLAFKASFTSNAYWILPLCAFADTSSNSTVTSNSGKQCLTSYACLNFRSTSRRQAAENAEMYFG
jgi:hypothetical protein